MPVTRAFGNRHPLTDDAATARLPALRRQSTGVPQGHFRCEAEPQPASGRMTQQPSSHPDRTADLTDRARQNPPRSGRARAGKRGALAVARPVPTQPGYRMPVCWPCGMAAGESAGAGKSALARLLMASAGARYGASGRPAEQPASISSSTASASWGRPSCRESARRDAMTQGRSGREVIRSALQSLMPTAARFEEIVRSGGWRPRPARPGTMAPSAR